MTAEGQGRQSRPSVEGAREERRQPQPLRGPERRDLLADRYELLELLGRGGSASVWHAYDKRLAREVALKIFHVGSQDREGLAFAMREAKAASHIVSDHVVRIRDVAWGGAKGAYIDMELCADFVDGELVVGRSMAQTPARDLREVVRWVMEAARGVQTAHDLRVFHRDLKPDNILIRPATRSAVVTDFGLARQPLWREEDEDTPLPGVAMGATWQDIQNYVGTPPYMPPEQAEGLFRHLARLPREPGVQPEASRDEDRLARIDVYGLGAILYEGLAGQAPYQPRQASADRTQEALDVLGQVRAGAPAALRGLPTLQLLRLEGRRFRVPRRLERIVRKAMARDPEQRYPTCAALARDLESFLEHQPTSFERHRYHARTALWSTRNWRPLLGSSLAVAGFVALFTLLPDEMARPAHAAVITEQLETAPPSVSVVPNDAPPARATPPASRAPAAPGAGATAHHRSGTSKAGSSEGGRTKRAWQRRKPTRQEAVPETAQIPSETAIARSEPPAAPIVERPGAPQVDSARRSADGPSAPDPLAARTNVIAFMDSVRRAPTPLIQVLDAAGTLTEYCLGNGPARGSMNCIPLGSFLPEERERLEKQHRQSVRSWIWHLDAHRRVIRKCEKSRPYDNAIIRKTCDPVVVG